MPAGGISYACGDLPPTAPVYGWWSWLAHPALTRRARALALADPTLGLYGSLTASRTAVRVQRRQTAIAGLLRRKLAQGRDPLAAQIAVTVYDLDEIAARLAAGADYTGLTALIAADLNPARLTGPAGATDREPDRAAPPGRTVDRPPGRTRRTPADRTGDTTPRQDTAAAKVARQRAKRPDATQAEVAKRTGLSVRTVSRHWAATEPDSQPDTAPANQPDTQPVDGAAVPQLADALTT